MSDVNYDVLTRPFPKEAIKQRKGANGIFLNYVEAHSVIRRLIEATGNNFNFRVLGVDVQDGLVMATCELEIGGSRRQQVGTVRLNGGNNDDAVKAAISDSLKKCSTLWGVGLELYGTDYEAEPVQAARPVQASPQVQGNGGNGNGGAPRQSRAVATAGNRTAFRPMQGQ